MMCSIAVVGWGNPDRRDDGAGWAIVERLRQGSPDVECHVDRLLAPESAELLQDKEHVLFIDAEVGGEGVSLRDLTPADEFRIDLTHHLPPDHLLALCLVLYGRAPRASLLTVEAFDLSLGEGLTDECAALIPEAVLRATGWISSLL